MSENDDVMRELDDLAVRERVVQRQMREHQIEPADAEAVLRQIWRRERELMQGMPYGGRRRRKAVLKGGVAISLVDKYAVRACRGNVMFGPQSVAWTADGERWMGAESSSVID